MAYIPFALFLTAGSFDAPRDLISILIRSFSAFLHLSEACGVSKLSHDGQILPIGSAVAGDCSGKLWSCNICICQQKTAQAVRGQVSFSFSYDQSHACFMHITTLFGGLDCQSRSRSCMLSLIRMNDT